MSSDAFGESQVLACACFPLNGIRQGVRSVPLCNQYMERIQQAALLVDVTLSEQ